MSQRQPGLTGRLPQLVPGRRLAIAYAHDYLTASIPPPTYPIDVSRGITAWGMLGNDQYGDCGEAGQLHYQMATGADPSAFTDQSAISEYLAFTQGQDTGVVLAEFLLWLYQKGEILGFAPVNLKNRPQVDSLVAIFKGLYVGVSLTDDAQQLFRSGSTWTTSAGEQPNPNLGHCILQVETDGQTDTYVTWGLKQLATRNWTVSCTDEAWVVVTTEDQAAKMDMSLLISDLDSLGGKHIAPIPPPDPTPVDPKPAGFSCSGLLGSGGGLLLLGTGLAEVLTR